MKTKTSLDKVTDYVVDIVLGGRDDTDEDARRTREIALVAIAEQPESFLSFARSMLCKHGSGENPRGWVMGAVHAFRDSHIEIDDINVAAKHIMEAVKKRFENEFQLR